MQPADRATFEQLHLGPGAWAGEGARADSSVDEAAARGRSCVFDEARRGCERGWRPRVTRCRRYTVTPRGDTARGGRRGSAGFAAILRGAQAAARAARRSQMGRRAGTHARPEVPAMLKPIATSVRSSHSSAPSLPRSRERSPALRVAISIFALALCGFVAAVYLFYRASVRVPVHRAAPPFADVRPESPQTPRDSPALRVETAAPAIAGPMGSAKAPAEPGRPPRPRGLRYRRCRTRRCRRRWPPSSKRN